MQAQGEEGESAQFTVCKKDSESGHVVTLQHGEKYLSVSEEKVELCDESSELKVQETEGCVSFESAKAAGHYISVQEDGSVQSGSELGPSTHFTVASAVKKEEPAPAENTEAAKEEEGKGQETNAAAETEGAETEGEKGEEQAEQKENKEPKQEEGQEEQSPSES